VLVRVAAAAAAGIVASAAGAASTSRVVVGQGIAGVRLGMTKAQVTKILGKPRGTTVPRRGQTCGLLYARANVRFCFDTRTRRVVEMDGIGREFCIAALSYCFQRAGGVETLRAHYGRRLRGPTPGGGQTFYVLVTGTSRLRTQTAFVVDTQSPMPFRNSSVTGVYITLCGHEPVGVVPRCRKP
jgi:hypothetical protein